MVDSPAGWLCVADPDWLDFLSIQSDLRSLVYYKGPCRPLTQLPLDAPFVCCRRGETPRRIHLIGMFNGYHVRKTRDAWIHYQRRLGVASIEEWEALNIGKDGQISCHELINFRFVDEPVLLSSTRVVLTNAASSMGRYLSAIEAKQILDSVVSTKSPVEAFEGEIVNPIGLFEGAIRQILVNSYERNRTSRKLCLSHFGHSCSVCKFNFRDRYGVIGDEYIHVHHLVPLSSIQESYRIDPICDLRPICPNCHAMIHTRTPPYEIEELRNLLKPV